MISYPKASAAKNVADEILKKTVHEAPKDRKSWIRVE